jgi:hypothetical protein
MQRPPYVGVAMSNHAARIFINYKGYVPILTESDDVMLRWAGAKNLMSQVSKVSAIL